MLALRLKKVLGRVISPLSNRQILDGAVVVNEVLDLAKRDVPKVAGS